MDDADRFDDSVTQNPEHPPQKNKNLESNKCKIRYLFLISRKEKLIYILHPLWSTQSSHKNPTPHFLSSLQTMLEALPSCFSGAAETSGSSSSSIASTKMSPNLVTCIYQLDIGGSPSFLTLTWSKTLVGQSLTLHLDRSACTIDISPSFFFFKNKPGSKNISFGQDQCRNKAKIFWDFTSAHYAHAAEPSSGFYLCLVYDGRIVFLLGDQHQEAVQRSGAAAPLVEPTLLSRREHVFGRRNYTTKARFGESERSHEIGIECSAGGSVGSRSAKLSVMVDGKLVLEVKHLQWKFRGNEKIFVDGSSVDIFWDVYNWLFCSSGNGHAVFMFQSGGGGGLVAQWPELVAAAAVPVRLKGPEKKLLRKSSSSTSSANSVLQWAESGGSSSGGSPTSGFSLLLYAWRSD